MRSTALVSLGGMSLVACGLSLVACAPAAPRAPGEPSVGNEPTAVLGQAARPAAAAPTIAYPVSVIDPPVVVPVEPDLTAPFDRSVTPSKMRARPISGGTLRVLEDGRTAVAADSDRDLVYVVDLVANKLTNTIALRPGDEPGRVVEDDAGRVHVALRRGGAVATIDPRLGTMLARRELCAAPRGLAFDPATKGLHVACAGGELVSIDAAPTTTKPSRTLMLERDLRDVVVKGDSLLVSSFRAAGVTVLKPLAVGANTMTDAMSTTRIAPPGDSFSMSAAVAWRMVEGPGSTVTMLHQRGQTGTVGTFPGAYGRGFGCGSIVDSTTSIIDADSDTITVAPTLQGALVAADLAVSPDGKQMAVVSVGGADQGRQVQFYSTGGTTTTTGPQPPTKFGFDCQAPDGAPVPPAQDPDGAGQHAADWLPPPAGYLPPNGQVVAVAYDQRGNVIVQSREPATLQILTQRGQPVVLSDESRFDAAQQTFHTATANNIACASCHPEGGEDGRTWMFQGFGARRTQSLRGGILNTAPFHWAGDEPGLKALMTDVFQGRMGGGSLNDTQVAALGSWLNEIPTIPPSRWSDDATLNRGKRLFASAGCATCHSGADFTNNQTVDVGTGGPMQVPQLHGIAFRAPYIHTGCAQTMKDRFTQSCAGDARHAVSTLTDNDISDLSAYLDTL